VTTGVRLSRLILKLEVKLEVSGKTGADERTARRDFQYARASGLQRARDEPRGDTAAARLRGYFRMRERDHAAGDLVFRHGRDAIGVKLEAGQGRVVADGVGYGGNFPC
jgi:hypothetical protein